MNQAATPSERLRDMVGCYSQALLGCSFNDDTILERLLNGSLDSFAKSPMMGRHWFDTQIGEYRRGDGNYAEQLTDAVTAAGGWPSLEYDDNSTTPVRPLADAMAEYGIAA